MSEKANLGNNKPNRNMIPKPYGGFSQNFAPCSNVQRVMPPVPYGFPQGPVPYTYPPIPNQSVQQNQYNFSNGSMPYRPIPNHPIPPVPETGVANEAEGVNSTVDNQLKEKLKAEIKTREKINNDVIEAVSASNYEQTGKFNWCQLAKQLNEKYNVNFVTTRVCRFLYNFFSLKDRREPWTEQEEKSFDEFNYKYDEAFKKLRDKLPGRNVGEIRAHLDSRLKRSADAGKSIYNGELNIGVNADAVADEIIGKLEPLFENLPPAPPMEKLDGEIDKV